VISRLATSVLVAFLLAAVAAAPLAAFCADCAGTTCCCGKKGACPKCPPSDDRRVRCCDGPEIVAPEGETSQVDSPIVASHPVAVAPVVATVAQAARVARDAPDRDPPGVALFTLHASLLI